MTIATCASCKEPIEQPDWLMIRSTVGAAKYSNARGWIKELNRSYRCAGPEDGARVRVEGDRDGG